MPYSAQRYLEVAEASWRWVLDQVRWDDGPWIAADSSSASEGPPWDRDGMHSGVGGLALTLAEIGAMRAWTDEESALADGIAQRLTRQVASMTDASYFDGLVSVIGSLTALSAGAEAAVDRLIDLAAPDGWPQTTIEGPRYRPGTRVTDLTLGTAGVLLGATWAHANGVGRAGELADHAAAVLLAESEEHGAGLDWPFVPTRFLADGAPDVRMPNLSHGLAGIATALALAGSEFTEPGWIDAAARGAHRLVEVGDHSEDGFVVPRCLPPKPDDDAITFTWCHGPTGTSLLFAALGMAGVSEVGGESVASWRRRCLFSVRRSGVPERRYPGFWDNDGRCCGPPGSPTSWWTRDVWTTRSNSPTHWSTEPSPMTPAPTGASSSIATPIRCCRRAPVGCRARRESRPRYSTRAAARLPAKRHRRRVWTTGGQRAEI